MASVRPESRLFIDKEGNNSQVIKNISINEALSRMDSESYPLVNVYVEDSISRKIVEKAIGILVVSKPKINKMINIVEVGSASQTYDYFKTKQKIYQKERINCGYACILDGDMREKKVMMVNSNIQQRICCFFIIRTVLQKECWLKLILVYTKILH